MLFRSGEDVSYWLSSAMKGLLLADYSFDKYISDKPESPELHLGILTGIDSASFKKEEQYTRMMAKAGQRISKKSQILLCCIVDI